MYVHIGNHGCAKVCHLIVNIWPTMMRPQFNTVSGVHLLCKFPRKRLPRAILFSGE